MERRNKFYRVARGIALIVLAMGAILGVPRSGSCQADEMNEVFVNSELETYLRVLQVGGKTALYPWSVRAFSPREVDRLAATDSVHPWGNRLDLSPDTSRTLRIRWIRPGVRLGFNSAFPYGVNDGPVWAGRGLTTAVQAGFSVRAGPASLTVAPVAFRAENAEFDLAPVHERAQNGLMDWRNPELIDLPQRFGDGAYSRIDPGQTTLRLDLPAVTFGVSTANQHWGPATRYPLLIGNNAPGFLHGFAGTSMPLNVAIGRLHGRVVWGLLDQSGQSPIQGREARRFMSGVVAVFTPRGLNGLELGGARFFHTPWPEGGISGVNVLKPFEGILKGQLKRTGLGSDSLSDVDNQIASIFGRWVFPQSGLEVYGEYSRDDHNYDLRDLTLEPDHDSGYMLGLRKLWFPSPERVVALRGEILDARVSHLNQVRIQVPLYTHFGARQGHTERGQIIGSPAAYGGAGAVLAADVYHPGGRWAVGWSRAVRQDAGEVRDSTTAPAYSDVLHSLEVETVFFRGRLDLIAGAAGVYNLNRNFSSDQFNLHLNLGVRVGL